MRNVPFFLAICLLVTAALHGQPEDLSEYETHVWLQYDGIFDPNVPNSQVHDLLSKGLKHEDPKIAHCSITTIVWYVGITTELQVHGKEPKIDRKLSELPGLYDLFMGMWEKGWEESKGVVPDGYIPTSEPPPDMMEAQKKQTECMSAILDPDLAWTSLAHPMASLFPGDEKVYDIIWNLFPQNGAHSTLSALFAGQFNKPKDQQLRIDFLTNPDTELYWSRLAARSLGDFRSQEGLETLVKTLEEQNLTWSTPDFVIVEAIMKYEKDAVPHIPLIRKTLENSLSVGTDQDIFKAVLKERFVHFEKKYEAELSLR